MERVLRSWTTNKIENSEKKKVLVGRQDSSKSRALWTGLGPRRLAEGKLLEMKRPVGPGRNDPERWGAKGSGELSL